jgi:peptidoglycan/xylan/chitin deacetylase (PgdA/CDA1 family)
MRTILSLFFSFYYLLADAHIFVYHRFDDPKHKSANTSSKQLREQFDYFKNNNYKVVPLEKILEKLSNKEEIPSNWVALTIDDAYKSFYQYGYPIFKQYNYPFSLFVYVEATNRRYGDFMTWEELKKVTDLGTLGLHSYSHRRVQNLTTHELMADTKEAYRLFTENLGIKPEIYAYPYGEYTDEAKNILKKSFDFKGILNQNSGSVNTKSDLYDINRIALVGDVNIEHKLRYNTFYVKWHEPKVFPKNGILKKIRAEVGTEYKKLKLYITGEGWRDVEVNKGFIDIDLNIYLKKARTRIILGPDFFTISNKIINKIQKKGK